MQAHEGNVEHVGGAQRIPGIEHAILAPADADAVGLVLVGAQLGIARLDDSARETEH